MANRVSVETTQFDQDDNEILIEAEVFLGNAGKIYGPVEKCHPPEPREIEDLIAKWSSSGKELTDEEIQSFVDFDLLYEEAEEKISSDEEGYWDQKFDEMRDKELEERFK